MFYLMKSKYAIFSNTIETIIERSAFGGHPVLCNLLIIFFNHENAFIILSLALKLSFSELTQSSAKVLYSDLPCKDTIK